MRWEDERWVKLYTRDTLDWLSFSFEAQALMCLLLRKVDRAGILELGKHGRRGVALAIGHPSRMDAIDSALAELLADGCVEIRGEALVIPNFVEAQGATSSDKARKQAQRERDRDQARASGMDSLSDSAKDRIAEIQRALDVTDCLAKVTPVVTLGHAESRAVTTRQDEPDETSQTRTDGVAKNLAPPAPIPVGAPPVLPQQLEAAGLVVPSPHPVPANQPPADAEPEGWLIPWTGPDGPRVISDRKPNETAEVVHWMDYRQGERTEHQDIAWGQVLKLVKRHVGVHGIELFRKAWLCWLVDPWAATREPPYAMAAFLAVDQVAKQVARAKRAEWVADPTSPEDWELPWLLNQENEHAG